MDVQISKMIPFYLQEVDFQMLLKHTIILDIFFIEWASMIRKSLLLVGLIIWEDVMSIGVVSRVLGYLVILLGLVTR